MNCLEARKCIDRYLNEQLEDEKLRAFVRHIEECRECREELEINYMIYAGVRKLDSGDSDLNISADFQRRLHLSRRRLKRRTARYVARCAVDTAAFWGVLVMVLMEVFRIG